MGSASCLAQAEGVDRRASLVTQEADAIAQAQLVHETQRLGVDLVRRHDVEDREIFFARQCLPQLHEPRLGEGSPVDAALEGEQDAMAPEIGETDHLPIEIR